MISLDSILAEVGPILGSSGHFSELSFGEVLAARQFADEINSGRLSVNDAYLTFWSHIEPAKPKELSGEYRSIRSEWRPALAHLSKMLSERSADEFICVVSESYLSCKEQIDMFSEGSFANFVLDDLALCARCIGEHPVLDSRDAVRQVLDTLLYVESRTDEKYDASKANLFWERSLFAMEALGFTKSSYVAIKVLERVKKDLPQEYRDITTCGNSLYMLGKSSKCLREVIKAEEDILIDGIKSESLGGDLHVELHLLGSVGRSVGAYEKMVNLLSNDWFEDRVSSSSKSDDQFAETYFSQIFKMVREHGFEPRLIDLLNGKVSKIKVGELTAKYRSALALFALRFKEESGLDLYGHLEKNKMQFWDYWMVYKPK